jgi:hypothetical protein
LDVLSILEAFKMQQSTQADCADTLVADVGRTIGNMEVNPDSVHTSDARSSAGLDFKTAAESLGLSYDRPRDLLTVDKFNSMKKDSSTDYLIGIHIPTGKGASAPDHWVGVKDIVSVGGKDYFSIAGSSTNDKPSDNNSTNRATRGWINGRNGQVLVPVDQVKDYWIMSRSSSESGQ